MLFEVELSFFSNLHHTIYKPFVVDFPTWYAYMSTSRISHQLIHYVRYCTHSYFQKTDQALLAQFYYADEDLSLITAELDTLDGRKQPAKCAALVAQLRQVCK